MNKHKAISLAELLVVIAIGIVVTTLSVSGFINLSNSDLIEAASQSLLSEFRQAYSYSIESLAKTTYGVHIATSSATIFSGRYIKTAQTATSFLLFRTMLPLRQRLPILFFSKSPERRLRV